MVLCRLSLQFFPVSKSPLVDPFRPSHNGGMDNTPFLWEDPRRKPWERLPDEPDKQFHAFSIFRDLGHSRTLREAYRLYADKPDAPKAQGYFLKWADTWRWQERVEAYDCYMDSAKVEAQKEGYAKQYHERGKTLADIEADT